MLAKVISNMFESLHGKSISPHSMGKKEKIAPAHMKFQAGILVYWTYQSTVFWNLPYVVWIIYLEVLGDIASESTRFQSKIWST